jgi:hypothetical protein
MIKTGLWTIVAASLLCQGSLAVEEPKTIAESLWSKPVADSRGYALRARLVLAERKRDEDRREVAVYVELQDASDFIFIGGSMQLYCEMGKADFRPEYKKGLVCELRDKEKQPVKSSPQAFGGAVPKSEWVLLTTDGTIRVRASPFGIHRPKAMAICPHLGQLWVIEDDDPSEYFLSGTFTIDPSEDEAAPAEGHVWRGTLELPAVKITNKRP